MTDLVVVDAVLIFILVLAIPPIATHRRPPQFPSTLPFLIVHGMILTAGGVINSACLIRMIRSSRRGERSEPGHPEESGASSASRFPASRALRLTVSEMALVVAVFCVIAALYGPIWRSLIRVEPPQG